MEAPTIMSPTAASSESTALNPVEALVSDLASPTASNPALAVLPPELQNDYAAHPPPYHTIAPTTPAATAEKQLAATAAAEQSGLAHNTAADKYLELMDRLRSHWKDRPDVLIQFRDIHYTVRVPIVDVTTRSFLSAGLGGLVRLVKRLDVTGTLRRHDRQVDLHALASCSGRISPGTMTLVLAPPGHGQYFVHGAVSTYCTDVVLLYWLPVSHTRLCSLCAFLCRPLR